MGRVRAGRHACASTGSSPPAACAAIDRFFAFWKNVVASGYSEEDLGEEVEMMIEGGSWVDFDDGRTT